MNRRTDVVLLLTMVLLVIPGVGCQKGIKVYVQCNPSLLAGYACTVEHREGNVRANVSWDLNITCRNGTLVTAHASQAVEPGGTASRIISIRDLHNFDRCDEASAASIENIKVVGAADSGDLQQLPTMTFFIATIIVIVTSGWVWIDAKSLGLQRGTSRGTFDMDPPAWFLACLLIWIVYFPAYLLKRRRYKAEQDKLSTLRSEITLFCEECRAPIPPSNAFCGSCGAAVAGEAERRS